MAKKKAQRRHEVWCFKPIDATVSASLDFLRSHQDLLDLSPTPLY